MKIFNKHLVLALTMSIMFACLTGCGSKHSQDLTKDIIDEQEGSSKVGTDRINNPDAEEITVTDTNTTSESVENETLIYDEDNTMITVEVPDGWVCENLKKQDIRNEFMKAQAIFYKEEDESITFNVVYWNSYGICGTGVTEEELLFANGYKGTMYSEEMEDSLWVNIIIDSRNENITQPLVMDCNLSKEAWEANKEEIFEILDTIVIQKVSAE